MQKTTLVKIAAVVGTVLVGISILAPFVFALRFIIGGAPEIHFDYLMPAELLPLVLLGGAILLWAAWRARRRFKLAAWALGAGLLALTAGLGLAQVTGVATAVEEPSAVLMAVVIVPILIFDLAVVVLFVAGILLAVDLFKQNSSLSEG